MEEEYSNLEGVVESNAMIYSFNFGEFEKDEIFDSLTNSQKKWFREEIEKAYINGGQCCIAQLKQNIEHNEYQSKLNEIYNNDDDDDDDGDGYREFDYEDEYGGRY
jgi:hypothetical protein